MNLFQIPHLGALLRDRFSALSRLAVGGILGCGLGSGVVWAESGQDPVALFPSIAGTVNAITVNAGNTTAYLGGTFSYIGYRAPYLAALDLTTGTPNPGFPFTNGSVKQVLRDGGTGYWVVGAFTVIGAYDQGVTVSNVAHVMKSGNTWTIAAVPLVFNSTINCAYLSGTTLYVGGNFSTVSGYIRNQAAAINVASGGSFGQLLPWDPNVNNQVNQIAVAGGHVWLGGNFTSVGPTSHQGLVSVDLVNGSVDQWSQDVDSSVSNLAVNGTTLFAGGNFTRSGYARSYVSRFGTASIQPDESFPQTNNAVYATISDGSGGWYIGGAFTQVGGIARNYLAHIKADATVDTTFSPQANNAVHALARLGSRIFVGGDFSQIGGQARAQLAAVDAITGLADSAWVADTNGQVACLSLDSSQVPRLWVGGAFTWIGNQARAHLAALDVTTGAPTSWRYGTDYQVNAQAISGTNLYVGTNAYYSKWGYYTPHLTGITVADGSQQPTFPAANGAVNVIIPDGTGGWYVGGDFTAIGSVTTARLAHVFSDGSIDLNWSPNADGSVQSLAVSGNILYVGGNFTHIGGAPRNYIAAIGCGTNPTYYGLATGWNAGANNTVAALAVASDGLYAGGTFTAIAGQNRTRLAKISLDTGVAITLSTFDPQPNDTINALAAVGNRLFVAGAFTSIAGQSTANRLVSFDATGALENWAPNPNSTVNAIQTDGTTCWIGGSFSKVNNIDRPYVAKISAAVGAITVDPWNPQPNNTVNDLVLSNNGSTVYLGGNFTLLGGQSHPYVASVDATNAVASTWSTTPDTSVSAIALAGPTLAIGGGFTWSQFQTSSGSGLKALDLGTQNPQGAARTNWSIATDNAVSALATASDGTLYVGGNFTALGGQTRQGLAAVDGSGQTTAFNGQLDGNIRGLSVNGTTLFLGGNFTTVAGSSRRGAASIDLTTGNATAFNAGIRTLNSVNTVVSDGSKIVVGGSYVFTSEKSSTYVLAMDATTGVVTPWTATPNYIVSTLVIDGGNLLIGGQFSTVNGVARQGIAGVAVADGSLLPWHPTIDGNVSALAVGPGPGANQRSCYLGGTFTNIGGPPRQYLGAVDADTGTTLAWNPGARYANPNSLLVTTDGVIHSSSSDGWYGGGSRANLAAIDLTTNQPLPWAPTANGAVAAISVVGTGANQSVFVGGSFTSINNQVRNYLAAIQGLEGGSSGTVTEWRADTNGPVTVIQSSGQNLYIGGSFDNAVGIAHSKVALIEAVTATTTGFFSAGTTTISFIASSGKTLNALDAIRIGGTSYQLANGVTFTAGVAQSVTLTSGLVPDTLAGTSVGLPTTTLPWNPGTINNTVNTLAVNGNRIYLGGLFTQVAGQTRNYLAAIDDTGALISTWNPNANSTINALLVDGSTIYATGPFTALGGVTHTRAAAIASDGIVTSWNPNLDNAGYTLAKGNHDLVVGGTFGTVNGVNHTKLSSIDPITSASYGNWPGFNSTVYEIIRAGSNLLVGGDFTAINSRLPHSGIALVPLQPASGSGDVNGDNVVNAADLALLLSHFGFSISDAGWDARCDLNSDGVVNVTDLNLVITNFGKTY